MNRANHLPGKILILSGVRGDTRRYRSLHLFEQLNILNTKVEVSHITHPKIAQQVEEADVVIFHRTAYDKFVDYLIKKIEKNNGIILSDIDDYIFDPNAFQWIDSPEFKNPIRVKLYKEEMERFRAMLEISSGILASTKFLANVVQQEIRKPAWVHRNAFNLQMLDFSEKAYLQNNPTGERVVIGYASGTPTHNKDFSLCKPYLKEILNQYPQVEIYLVGSIQPNGDWGKHQSRVKIIPLVRWQSLPSILAQFDINLAPLISDNPFNQSKSEIKYMEAGLVKVPTIASSTDSYNYAIHSGTNGILIYQEDEWFTALSSLIVNKEARQQMGENAYHHVTEKYHPFYRAQELVNTLKQATSLDLHPNTSDASQIQQNLISVHPDKQMDPIRLDLLEKDPSIIGMGIYTLKHRGFHQITLQSMLFILRALSTLQKTIRNKTNDFFSNLLHG
jgi:glycosyltransferase involved in cell wall biosynthesis